MKAREIMSSPVETLHAGASLDEALNLLAGLAIRHLPVMEEGELKGLVFDADLLHATGGLPSRVREIYQDPQEVRKACVGDLARMPRIAQPDDDPLELILAQIDSNEDFVDAVLVVEGGEPIGIVTDVDLLRAWSDAGEPALAGCVSEIMCADVQAIERSTTLAEAQALLGKLSCHHLPVEAPEGLVGIVSARDLERAHGQNRKDDYRIDELMSEQPATVRAEDSIKAAVDRMLQFSISALPVVDENKELVGIVTTSDLLRYLGAARKA